MSKQRFLPVGIEITFLWLREDPEIYFVVSNGRNALEVKLFQSIEDVSKFAELLECLPQGESPQLTQKSFRVSGDRRFDNGIGQISAVQATTGENYVLEAKLHSPGAPEFTDRFSVSVNVTQAQLNELGRTLTTWIRENLGEKFNGEKFVFWLDS